jgi:hypothetical protein
MNNVITLKRSVPSNPSVLDGAIGYAIWELMHKGHQYKQAELVHALRDRNFDYEEITNVLRRILSSDIFFMVPRQNKINGRTDIVYIMQSNTPKPSWNPKPVILAFQNI